MDNDTNTLDPKIGEWVRCRLANGKWNYGKVMSMSKVTGEEIQYMVRWKDSSPALPHARSDIFLLRSVSVEVKSRAAMLRGSPKQVRAVGRIMERERLTPVTPSGTSINPFLKKKIASVMAHFEGEMINNFTEQSIVHALHESLNSGPLKQYIIELEDESKVAIKTVLGTTIANIDLMGG